MLTHQIASNLFWVDIRNVELEGDRLGLGLELALHHVGLLADLQHREFGQLVFLPGPLLGPAGFLLACDG